jgi:hypothetical protein
MNMRHEGLKDNAIIVRVPGTAAVTAADAPPSGN